VCRRGALHPRVLARLLLLPLPRRPLPQMSHLQLGAPLA
jgi:hypothetical protein